MKTLLNVNAVINLETYYSSLSAADIQHSASSPLHANNMKIIPKQ